MRRTCLSLLAVGLPLLVATLAASAGGSERTVHGNNFYSNCPFSHAAKDDPIVYPGEPGRSHAHTFFGNRSTNASSTLTTLRASGTTCKPRADRAAYWIPSLFQNGREVRPMKAQLYYVVRGYGENMRPFPAGLRMIAGDRHATRPQSTRVTFWACGGQAARTRPSASIPRACGIIVGHGLGGRGGKVHRVTWRTKSYLELHVLFPDCWDGKRLDAPDHQSHMAYSRHYECPAAHPVKVPLIRMMVRYPVDHADGIELASGGQYSGHADFFNAWNETFLARIVNSCFHERGCRPY